MLCEKYKPALIGAAITGDELAPAIREHVESCARCAAEWAQQRSLIAAIDANLHRQMNAPVPAATLQRLEAHLAQQPQPARTPRFAQIFAGTLATLAVAATIFLMLPHKTVKTTDVKQIAPPPINFIADQSRVDTNPLPETERITPAHRPRLHKVARSTEPEVLVPPDEQVALDHFVAQGNARREFVVALATPIRPVVEPSFKGLEIPDINTAELVIQPISTEARR
jgi:hypothetical protein